MRILITNDDGFQARGIHILAEIMKQFGDVTVLAPSEHQSGKSMAVDLGRKGLVYTDLCFPPVHPIEITSWFFPSDI